MEALLFSLDQIKSPEELIFEQSPLGQIHAQIPFEQLADCFRIYKPPRHKGGRRPHLSIEGGLGLMFLKHHLKLSDRMLIERLNTDRFLQLFCFTQIPLHKPIRDKDLVGRWRRFFGLHMDMGQLQDKLAEYWKPHLENTHVLMDDATCYESHIKYPTDVKLLLDCCTWLDKQIIQACRFYGLALPRRDKYRKAIDRAVVYQKLKRKPKNKEKRLRRSLLYWLDQWQEQLQIVLNLGAEYHQQLDQKVYDRIKVIRIIYQQQSYMLAHNVRKVAHRIVSLFKPYIRPIIRGKERKKYEFGAKAHISQVDGLNFIEHLSFEAFHEGIRMWYSIAKHKKRFGKCTHYAADRIYATNANRRKAKKLHIQTCFVRKGPKAKDEKQRQKVRSILAKERATRLEGSFGTEKQHYGADRIKARTQETEIAWIFFAIHTANAVRLARRIAKRNKQKPHRARAA